MVSASVWALVMAVIGAAVVHLGAVEIFSSFECHDSKVKCENASSGVYAMLDIAGALGGIAMAVKIFGDGSE